MRFPHYRSLIANSSVELSVSPPQLQLSRHEILYIPDRPTLQNLYLLQASSKGQRSRRWESNGSQVRLHPRPPSGLAFCAILYKRRCSSSKSVRDKICHEAQLIANNLTFYFDRFISEFMIKIERSALPRFWNLQSGSDR